MSKRLVASAAVGALLVISTVLVVSLIGGDDKPDINNEIPPEDEQLPEIDEDDVADDDSSDNDADTSSDETSDDETPDEEVPDDGADEGQDDKGNGQKKGQLHRHMEFNSGVSQENNERNYAEHVSMSCAEDAPGEGPGPEENAPEGEPRGEPNGDGKCQSGK